MPDAEKDSQNGTAVESDEAELARMGYKQELQCVSASMYRV
jgi:hypothetical protein